MRLQRLAAAAAAAEITSEKTAAIIGRSVDLGEE